MSKEFTNENRNRYYGLRIGDIVMPLIIGSKKNEKTATVVYYGIMDNNAVYLMFENKEVKKWVAEWCDIIRKIETFNFQCKKCGLGFDSFESLNLHNKMDGCPKL